MYTIVYVKEGKNYDKKYSMFSKIQKPMPEKNWKSSFNQFPLTSPEKVKKEPKPPKPLKRTPIARVWLKKRERLDNGWSEVDVFRWKWNNEPRICAVCWKAVKDAFVWDELKKSYCFPHILAKGMYPQFRLLPANISIVCSMAHHAEFDKKNLDLEFRRLLAIEFEKLIAQ